MRRKTRRHEIILFKVVVNAVLVLVVVCLFVELPPPRASCYVLITNNNHRIINNDNIVVPRILPVLPPTTIQLQQQQQQQQEQHLSLSISDTTTSSVLANENVPTLSTKTMITISHEGRTCIISILPNESILDALERQSVYIQSQLVSLSSDIPYHCRRGNCLTCAAKCSIMDMNNNNNNNANNLQHDLSSSSSSSTTTTVDISNSKDKLLQEYLMLDNNNNNGLSPTISKLIFDQGYILTCSTYLNTKKLHVDTKNEANILPVIPPQQSSSASLDVTTIVPPPPATTTVQSSISEIDNTEDTSTIDCTNIVLELGVHNGIWDSIYQHRFTNNDHVDIGRYAMARVIRKSNEQNISNWIQSTEQILHSTSLLSSSTTTLFNTNDLDNDGLDPFTEL